MKNPRLLTLLLVLFAALAGLAPRAAQAELSFSYFYDSLDPYGDWIEVGGYGYCWHPDGVDEDWAPYTDGYWSFTDAGWTWVSYEDWGAICYHYGRWVKIEDEGWCWVPDYQWGPAWVSWRHNDSHIGWAPLPPEAHFRREVGLSVWVDTSYDIGPSYYNFCDYRDFGSPVIREVIFPRARNVTFIENTVNITNITYNDRSRVIYNGGPRYDFIAERSSRRVPTLKLVQNTNINVINNTVINNFGGDRAAQRAANPLPRALQRGNSLEVFAPAIAPRDNASALRPAKIAKVVAPEKVNKGWAGVKDPEARNVLRQKLVAQTKGLTPESAPAKPLQIAELKEVPVKADPTAASPAATAKIKTGKKGAPLTAEPLNPPSVPPQTAGRENGKRGPEKSAPIPAVAVEKAAPPVNQPAIQTPVVEPLKTGKASAQIGKNGKVKAEPVSPPAVTAEQPAAPTTGPAAVPPIEKGKRKTAADAVALPQPVTTDQRPTVDPRKEAADAKANANAVTARDRQQAAAQTAADREKMQAQAAEQSRAKAQATQQAAENKREKLQAQEADQLRSRAALKQKEQADLQNKQAERAAQATASRQADQAQSRQTEKAADARRAAQDDARQQAVRQQQAESQREVQSARAAQVQQQRAADNQRGVQQQRAAEVQQQRAAEGQREAQQQRAAQAQQAAAQQRAAAMQQEQQQRPRQVEAPRPPQIQRQPQPVAPAQIPAAQPQGKGKKALTPEEAAALQRR